MKPYKNIAGIGEMEKCTRANNCCEGWACGSVYNPSHSGGGDWENHGSSPAQAKI
jgi:hypothetical protein